MTLHPTLTKLPAPQNNGRRTAEISQRPHLPLSGRGPDRVERGATLTLSLVEVSKVVADVALGER